MKKCSAFLIVLCLLIGCCSFLSGCQRLSADYNYYSNRACVYQDNLYYVLNTDEYGKLYCNEQKIYSCLGYGFRSVFVNDNYIFLSVCSIKNSFQMEKVYMLDKQGCFIRDFNIVSATLHGDNEYVFSECSDYKYYIDLATFTVAELSDNQQIGNWKYIRKMLINLNTNINALRYYKQHEEVIGTTEQGLFIFNKSLERTKVVFVDYATNTDIEVFSDINNDPFSRIIGQLDKNAVLVRRNHQPVNKIYRCIQL